MSTTLTSDQTGLICPIHLYSTIRHLDDDAATQPPSLTYGQPLSVLTRPSPLSERLFLSSCRSCAARLGPPVPVLPQTELGVGSIVKVDL